MEAMASANMNSRRRTNERGVSDGRDTLTRTSANLLETNLKYPAAFPRDQTMSRDLCSW